MVLGSARRRLMELESEVLKQSETSQSLELPLSYSPSRPSITAEALGFKITYVIDSLSRDLAMSHLLGCSGPFGLDIETYGQPQFLGDKQAGLNPHKSFIRLIQIYDGHSTVFVFDLLKLGDLADFFDATLWDKPMVAHNALFELKHLMHIGCIPRKLGCTLLSDRVLNGTRTQLRSELGLSTSAGLKSLAKELLSLDVSKEEQTSDWSAPVLTQEQMEYAALDAFLPVKIFEKQRGLLHKHELAKSYEILRDAQHAVARMEIGGIGFDILLHRSRMEEWKRERSRLQEEIHQSMGEALNLNSGKQLEIWIKKTLEEKDLIRWPTTPGGKLSTDTPTFKLQERLHPIFPKIIEYRHVAKNLSSFGEGLYEFIDTGFGRLYSSFSLGNTCTGRMTSQKPNMQQMPRIGFRDLFTAKEGYVLIGLDYSQQELRVAALITKDQELLRIYEEAGDVHINTAAAILKIPKEAVTKPQRQLAKAVIFGLLYGQGVKGLATYAKEQYGVDMTEAEAKEHRENLFHAYQGLRKWQQLTGNRVKITGKIRTVGGRLRDFHREIGGYSYTAALNHPIQGTASEITLRALTRLTPLISNECRLVNVIHDEILLEVIESRAQEMTDSAKKVMTEAFLDIFPSSVPYLQGLVEGKLGKNWGETK